MNSTVKEVLEFVRDNDVKFIRLAFCDINGVQKNISIMPSGLQDAFLDGVSFDASAIKGFQEINHSDLLLVPDPQTMSILPWRPQQGRVIRFYCDVKNPDGTSFKFDTRNILKEQIKKVEEMGYICKIGPECEFYLFKTDEFGNPTNEPFDQAGYFDIAPLDKGENVRREICFNLEEMGIFPKSSHHEHGPGQNEITFKESDALNAADNLITFKSVVKVISARNGLSASFLPKPLQDKSGNGLHINISLSKNGFNVFEKEDIMESFIAGVLDKAREISLFLNSIENSYKRLGSFEAPKYISWSKQNRSPLIRIPAAKGEKIRMELRSPDPSCNPYLAFALIINAGITGIKKGMILPKEVDEDLFAFPNDDLMTLPDTLSEAIEISKKSIFIMETIGEEMLDKFIKVKEKEIKSKEEIQNI